MFDHFLDRLFHIFGLPEKMHLHSKQITKFGITGVINTFIDMGSLAFFLEIVRLSDRLSVVLGIAVSLIFAFFMHKHWTFGNKEKKHAIQSIKFLSVYGSSAVIAIYLTLFLLEFVGLNVYISRAIVIPFTAIWNYLWMHFGVFKS